MSDSTFGTRLRELRLSVGLTLRDLAEKVNVSFTYLSKIENGALPPPSEKVIFRLAEALNVERDELLSLAGIIPPDIAEIVKDRQVREQLRSRHAKQQAAVSSEKRVSLPKVSFKRLYRLALPVLLVLAVAASLWFASPTPVEALSIDISNPSTGTLGSNYTFDVTVNVQSVDLLPIQSVNLRIYNSSNPSNYTVTYNGLPLPTPPNTTSSTTFPNTGGGAATISGTTGSYWGYALDNRTGYGYGYQSQTWETLTFGYTFGYGYGYGTYQGTTSITYHVVWTPPTSWASGIYKIEAIVYGTSGDDSKAFVNHSAATFTLNQAAGGGGGGTGISTSGSTTRFSTTIQDSSGTFKQDVTVTSQDNRVKLDIDEGVQAQTKDGKRLSAITIKPLDTTTVLAPPAGTIGLAYDLGPDGATFDPPITLTFNYDPATLPDGVDEADLSIAYYDSSTGEWVKLSNITVDPANNTISGDVSHFTTFAIVVPEVAEEPAEEPAPTPTPTPAPTEPTPAPTEPTPTPTEPAPTAEPTEPEPTPAPTPAPTPEPEPTGMAGWLIAVIVVVAIIVIALIIWLVMRRRS